MAQEEIHRWMSTDVLEVRRNLRKPGIKSRGEFPETPSYSEPHYSTSLTSVTASKIATPVISARNGFN